MDPRYQVFISSTFRDLVEERQAVLAAVLELGHFPAGMEAFPAASATPLDLIKKIISESDYYILIIGGRYGSTDEAGISYTELEYDLASKMGIPTLIFPHFDPDKITAGKTEMEPLARERLAAFRRKVEKHHCKQWKSPEDLQAKVVLGLSHEIRVNPRAGWIRGDTRDSPETLKKMNSLLEQNAALSRELDMLNNLRDSEPASEARFAHQDEMVVIESFTNHNACQPIQTSWKELFRFFAPFMIVKAAESELAVQWISKFKGVDVPTVMDINAPFNGATRIDISSWKKITLQFLALGYWEPVECEVSYFDPFGKSPTSRTTMAPGFKLTSLGVQRYAEAAAVLNGAGNSI